MTVAIMPPTVGILLIESLQLVSEGGNGLVRAAFLQDEVSKCDAEVEVKHHADVIDCVVLVHKTALGDKCLVAYLESKKGKELNL